jgi:ABC-type glycerol-3-phosphate transport system substrate-binding protein
MTKRRSVALAAAALLVAGIGLGGCSGGEPATDTTTDVDTSIDIEGSLGGDESVELGDIDTGSNNNN